MKEKKEMGKMYEESRKCQWWGQRQSLSPTLRKRQNPGRQHSHTTPGLRSSFRTWGQWRSLMLQTSNRFSIECKAFLQSKALPPPSHRELLACSHFCKTSASPLLYRLPSVYFRNSLPLTFFYSIISPTPSIQGLGQLCICKHSLIYSAKQKAISSGFYPLVAQRN